MVESKFDIDRSKNKSLSHGDNLLIISSLNVEKHIWLLNIVHMANVKYNILELSIGRVSTWTKLMISLNPSQLNSIVIEAG